MKTYKGLNIPESKGPLEITVKDRMRKRCKEALRGTDCGSMTCLDCLFYTAKPKAVKLFREWEKEQ